MSGRQFRPDWFCPVCNFKVFGSKEFCGKCNIRNPAFSTSTSVTSNSSSSSSSSTISSRSIEQTNKLQEKISNISDQIFDLSDKMTDQQFKTILDDLKTCYDTASQPTVIKRSPDLVGAPLPLTNDWWCRTCSMKIFASKETCRKCGTRRPQ